MNVAYRFYDLKLIESTIFLMLEVFIVPSDSAYKTHLSIKFYFQIFVYKLVFFSMLYSRDSNIFRCTRQLETNYA